MDDAAYAAALQVERSQVRDPDRLKDIDAELRRIGVNRATKQGVERAVNTPKETR